MHRSLHASLIALVAAVIILTVPLQAAVGHDAMFESHTGTTGSASEASYSWTHTPVGTPRGVLVFTMSHSTTDIATSVTYGGSGLSAVSGGYVVTDAGGEPGDVKAWFLGSSVPTGAQTVQVNRTNNATVMWGCSATVTGAADTEVYTTGIQLVGSGAGDGTLAEVNTDDGSPGANSVRYVSINSGLGTVPGTGTNTSCKGASCVDSSIDFGNRTAFCGWETTAGQGSRPVGYSSGTADERPSVHLAVRETGAAPPAPKRLLLLGIGEPTARP